jgi:hypothetical protein
MGLVYAEIQLSNPVEPQLNLIKTNALVDSRALHLCIPKHLALQLKLTYLEEREVTLADGSRQLIPYAGPVKVIKYKINQPIQYKINVLIPS